MPHFDLDLILDPEKRNREAFGATLANLLQRIGQLERCGVYEGTLVEIWQSVAHILQGIGEGQRDAQIALDQLILVCLCNYQDNKGEKV